ncbi:glycerophosphodiester phosphodiesterase [Membranihabitans marinus]|uniref:glycerophosphodiester phosphodiesterase n=1 Tax=Membranihabitans marinus TaxID=1227546 RepID=UPI001F47D019|nr:glycerophosphodiester phosphodiesterase family protein [Membranihabitans marinus]
MKTFYVFLLSFIINTPLSMAQKASIIAHRGASYIAPENTMAAAQLGWELGADAVEVDVYVTGDGEIIVSHDKDTERTTNKKLKISDTDLKTLQSLDAGSWKDSKYAGEPMPSLREIMAVIPYGKKLVVEIKCGVEIIEPLKELMSELEDQSQIVFIAFGWDVIQKTKETFPNNKCYWLSGRIKEIMAKWSDILSSGLDGINVHYNVINEDFMAQAKKDGMPVLSWTIDDFTLAKKLTDLGVVGITTNRPGVIRSQYLNE